ncbi:MAG: hypothetical protein CSA05_02965 [Bacteroidia bacterium]|nr:MAG: hypothetical protein CSA05_02965 [Bacteroidia bacterium]
MLRKTKIYPLVCLILTASCIYLFLQKQKLDNKLRLSLVEAEKNEIRAKKQLIIAQENQAKSEKLLFDLVELQEKNFSLIEKLYQISPNDNKIRKQLVKTYSDMSWYYLINKQFDEAKKYAEKGLKIIPSEKSLLRNLALSCLFTDNYDKTIEIYHQLKNKNDGKITYRDIFLGDLLTLENEGISHENIDLFYKLIKNEEKK